MKNWQETLVELDFYTARRKKLEQKAMSAALELLAFTRTAAALLPVPGTTPRIFLAIGEAKTIREAVESAEGKTTNPNAEQ